MKKLFYLLILAFQFGFSQTSNDSIIGIQIKTFGTNYKDFLVIEKNVFAITNGDSLIGWNLDTNDFQFIKKDISTIVKTSNNNIIVGTKKGLILRKNGDVYEKILNIKTPFYKLLVDKNDDILTISNRGIHHKNKKNYPYNSKISHPYFGDYESFNSFAIPNVAYLDNNNLLWLTYDNGEFGQTILFFDLKTRKFFEEKYLSLDTKRVRSQYYDKLQKAYPDKIKKVDEEFLFKFPCNLPIYRPIKGICQDEQSNFYFSQSLMHFFLSGCISKYVEVEKDFYKKIDLSSVLEHKKNINKSSLSFKDVTEYLGPIQHNRYDGKIYYYTDNGFFKILQNDKELSKEFIFRPALFWKFGLNNSVGYQMNVKKFEFISENEMLFLTSSNGIGYYDGVILKYYQ